jgi:colanic acid biosynthesis glycosyl transferase WcaI
VAFALAAAGQATHAVTSRLRYDGAGPAYPAYELVEGVHVHRIWSTRFGRGALLGRALDYLTFYFSALFFLVGKLEHGDIAVAKTDPPLVSVVVALAAMLKRARLVNWLQDVFPEAATRSGLYWLAGPLGAIAAAARNWSVRRAVVNVALGERMAAEIGRLVPEARVEVVPNWVDGEAIAPRPTGASALRREWDLEGRFVVGYAGNLGRVHDVDTVLGAARLLRAEASLLFLFVGGGHGFARLREAELENVALRAYVPEEQLGDCLAACNLQLVTLAPAVEGFVVPSKFYAALAAGRPVLFVGDPDGEVARAVRRHECGIAVRAGDPTMLVEAILRLRDDAALRQSMGARAREAFEAHYARPVGLARWRDLLIPTSPRQ